MRLLDEHDPSLRTGAGPVAFIGPVSGPQPAPALGCDGPYAGVKFTLANKAAKSGAAVIRIIQVGGGNVLEMLGIPSVFYRPEVTIAAPDDPTAKQFQVGFIQNLLWVWRKAYYDDGSVVHTDVPTLPIKDGKPLSSGQYDPVFMSSQDTEAFEDKDDVKDLRFGDNPVGRASIDLLGNPSCVGPRLPGTMVRMEMYDEFRTWLAVRHKPTGCVRALHHIDWNLHWEANVTMNVTLLGNVPALTVTSKVSNVTEANGDGRPGFIQGGQVANDIARKICV
jgi:hypothetical protein